MLLCHRRHDRTHYPDVWDLPGGHIEEGESRIDALVRELTEELGVVPELAEDSPWLTLTTDGLALDIYRIDRWRGEPHNVAVEEHDEIRWVTAAELTDLDLAHSSYIQMLRRALP